MSRKRPQPPAPGSNLSGALFVPILIFVGVIVFAALVLVFGGRLTGGGPPATRATGGQMLDAQTMERFAQEWDELGVSIGASDAPVVVREFADYQCPACAAFEATAERLREKYLASGQVRFVFFDFPLSMHSHSRAAAAAARCAGRQKAYWTYHKKLFATQDRWAGTKDPTEIFLNLAVESAIQIEPFKQCLVQGGTDVMVEKSAEVARSLGVSSTPTALVGQRVFSGITPFETLVAEIESQLAAQESDR